ncbi:hypothetical protein ACF3NA_02640 [Alkanindiges sp. WGS2144]|uniref:hypothetical protein n=1 Tax=Alkanindiges sp. WGS2144 TaxID=3366808 RepID=UPI003751AD3D
MNKFFYGLSGLCLALSGCTSFSHYVVSSQFVASSQEQQSAEVIATRAYHDHAGRTATVALRAPDSCSNNTADQASGGAKSQGSILMTNCGVEMAEIEKALARANYKVISWNILANEMAHGRSAAEVAKSLGADILFQINSLEKSKKTLGKDARWERQYFQADARGNPRGEQLFPDTTRNFIKNTYLNNIEKTYDPSTLAVTLDASAVLVETGQSIWYYRWTHASEPSKVGSHYLLQLNCMDGSIYACQVAPVTNTPGMDKTVLASGESDAVSVSEKPEDKERAIYAELLKEVIEDFVKNYSKG